jgi:diguanylate cyclase (GGDEF)-like protein
LVEVVRTSSISPAAVTEQRHTDWLSPPGWPRGEPFQRVSLSAFAVLRERDADEVRNRVLVELLDHSAADAVDLYEPDEARRLELVRSHPADAPEDDDRAFALRLAKRAFIREKSLLSTHEHLDADLRAHARVCAARGTTTMALLLRAHHETHGIACLYWRDGHELPDLDQLRGIYYVSDFIGLALGTARWRARALEQAERLERLAYTDDLTGLPNGRALAQELRRLVGEGTAPLSLLLVDFDGLREANNALGYEEGGDALIRAVGVALPGLVRPGELAARAHSAGDEFVCLLPGVDESEVESRARELERSLEHVELPLRQRRFYRGASVGGVTAEKDETADALLSRAAEAMRLRKELRARR